MRPPSPPARRWSGEGPAPMSAESSRWLDDASQRPVIPSSRWPVIFVIFEFSCQVALLFPQLSGLRVVFRAAPFVASLALLVLLRGKKTGYHPTRPAAVVIIL